VLGKQAGRHARLERARRDRVDQDLRGQLGREVAGEHVHGGLAGAVGEVLELRGRHPDAVDAADVHHPGRVVRCGRSAQLGQQCNGQVEDAAHVDVQHLVPALVRELRQRRAPGRTGIVEQCVNLRFERGNRPGELRCTRFRADVRRYRGDVAPLAELFGGGLQLRGFPAAQIDLCAGPQQAGGNHVADAPAASGDHRDLAGEVEKVRISSHP